MKKRRTFFYTMLAAGLLASCTNDELADNPLADGSVAAQVTADISQTLTRVSANGVSASFTSGDEINVVPCKTMVRRGRLGIILITSRAEA